MNKIEDLKDLRINFNDEMKKSCIKLITIKQILKNETLTGQERKILQKEFDDLFKIFKDEFQKLNQEQIRFINWYLGK